MKDRLRYKGRLAQTRIYFGKCIRMFVYQNDWKFLPISALIAAVVTFVVGTNMFQVQEGTQLGVFALTCVCVWNGFFNSIQVVCRERDIIKREHRAGLYMSSYIFAQMIYQLLLCLAQTAVTLVICSVAGIRLPEAGIITRWGTVDMGITILLTTYAADMMALMVSCLVRTTTTAMTTMPFLLLFQLVFSGGFFELEGAAEKVQYVTLSHWGMNSLCAIGRYNEQPMVSAWNMLVKFKDIEVDGQKPLKDLLINMSQTGRDDEFLLWSGQQNQAAEYASTAGNVMNCWIMLLILLIVFAAASIIALQFIDRDKR